MNDLPDLTRQQIGALILDLDLDAREVIIRAVAELWQRELGEADRDVLEELDDLRNRIDAIEFARRAELQDEPA